jgi:flagellar biosynthesis protein FliR
MKAASDTALITAVLLVAIRVGPLFILAPVFGAPGIPLRFRVLFGIGLSALLVAGLHIDAAAIPHSVDGLIAVALAELIIGAAIAFGLFAAFGAFLFGGRLIDSQVGFAVANLIDPITRAQGPLLGTVLNVTAIAVFLAVDGHHLIVRGLADSLARLPLGQPITEIGIGALIAQFGVVFSHGLMLVAPAVFALLLLDVALAVVARTMPQMNIFIVSLPLKVFVGLLVMALSARYMLPTMRRVFETLPTYWNGMLT